MSTFALNSSRLQSFLTTVHVARVRSAAHDLRKVLMQRLHAEVFRCLVADVRIQSTPMTEVERMTDTESLSEEQQVFLKHIQKKGLKRTSQRDLILNVFLRTEEHLSNEDLYNLV